MENNPATKTTKIKTAICSNVTNKKIKEKKQKIKGKEKRT